MDSWHATFLGRRHLPREVMAFEVEVFFQFSAEEAWIIEERRRRELKLRLTLQIGFLRMSGIASRCSADGAAAALVALGQTIQRRMGEAQLPELILGVDSEVRFSWIMLGREMQAAAEALICLPISFMAWNTAQMRQILDHWAQRRGGRERRHHRVDVPKHEGILCIGSRDRLTNDGHSIRGRYEHCLGAGGGGTEYRTSADCRSAETAS